MDRVLLSTIRSSGLFTAFLALLLTQGCDMINPQEPTPTYVQIDSFSFSGDEHLTGTNSHKITTVYAYLNNQSLGVFDLPAKFPVILDKPGTITVTPGIDNNGIGAFPIQYPFYRSDTMKLSPAPGTTVRMAAKTRYFDFVKLQYNVDFEASNPFNVVEGTAGISYTAAPGEVFEGFRSGKISMNGPDSAVIVNTNPFKLPANQEAYLELNYKSNMQLTVGLNTTTAGIERTAYLVGFYPKETWNKVYISLRTFASTYQGSDFYLLLRAVKDTPGSGYVLIDNLKIVSF